MTIRLAFVVLVALSMGAALCSAQQTAVVSENGAVNFSAASGWAFGLPAVRAAVVAPGGSALSPEKKTLVAPGFGMSVKAWKFLEPFMDFTVIDTGKAWAQVGSYRSDAQAETYAFHGGLRLIGSNGRVRPYAQFGGGALHQSLKATFTVAGRASDSKVDASLGSLTYGAGLRLFAGRHWGSDIGFDGFHLSKQMASGGQNYSRVRVGVFYQTKSTIQ